MLVYKTNFIVRTYCRQHLIAEWDMQNMKRFEYRWAGKYAPFITSTTAASAGKIKQVDRRL